MMTDKPVSAIRTRARFLKVAAGVFAALLLLGAYVAQRLLGAPAVVVPPDVHMNQHLEFLVIGDQGSGNRRQWQVAHAMEAVAEQDRQVGFVIVLGDNFYSRGIHGLNDLQWRYKFENVYRGRYLSSLNFYAVLGNHDYLGKPDVEVQYSRLRLGSGRWRMPANYYVRDYGQVDGRPLLRVVYLDSNLTGKALATEMTFLERALISTPGHEPVWRAIASHHPLQNFGRHSPQVKQDIEQGAASPRGETKGGDNEDEEGNSGEFVDAVLAAIRVAPVDFVLSGHDHDQQVIAQGTKPLQILTGAAGRKPYTIEQQGPGLRYAASENGFVKMELDPDVMQFAILNSDGATRARFRWNRSCAAGSETCLKNLP